MTIRKPTTPLNARELLDVLIRAGLIAALTLFCYQIFQPFLGVMLWAVILAVTLNPVNRRMANAIGISPGKSALLLVLLILICLMVPLSFLGESLATSVQVALQSANEWNLTLPPPTDTVQGWPIIGKPLFQIWSHASSDLTWAMQQVVPHLKGFSTMLLLKLAGVGTGILVFVLALIIAGLFIAHGDSSARKGVAIAKRVFNPERGEEMATLCAATIRAVAQGVVGIAFIQMLLVGVGLVIMGVPGAGLLALLVLLLGIMQLPVLLITAPIVIYVISQQGVSTPTVLFSIWTIAAGLSDNVLKPLMLGRGVAVPMPVILIGALGGMISFGFIGLFIGPVVLAIGYELFETWVAQAPEAQDAAGLEVDRVDD
ncbi:AI-2E family transporter [Pseudomonas chlororaphis]|uniref:AI-2E family transporter n=1 Tax=Pseudomonas chlororaphis TaxID=587753 RepID=A0A1Q8ER63_9PSED|nr:AI-2E family transporter [Pseudomonas chlororaphis]OLF54270.1 AI-2E family transporter [Pseudomonas chlororaphis]